MCGCHSCASKIHHTKLPIARSRSCRGTRSGETSVVAIRKAPQRGAREQDGPGARREPPLVPGTRRDEQFVHEVPLHAEDPRQPTLDGTPHERRCVPHESSPAYVSPCESASRGRRGLTPPVRSVSHSP